MKKDSRPEWKVIIDLLAQIDDAMFNRIIRRMIYYLYSQKVKEIDKLMSSLEPSYATAKEASDDLYVNVPRPKRTRELLAEIADSVFEIAGETLPDEEIAENIRLWMTQERTRFFTSSFKNRNISLIKAIDEITRFFNIPRSEIIISPEEFVSIRTAIISRFLSSNLSYINIAKNYITVRDFRGLLADVIGPYDGAGKLGGKAAGLILAAKILESAKNEYPELKDIKIPRSWYVASDTIMDFVHFNALEEVLSVKYMDTEQIRTGYPYLIQLFKNSFWSPEIVRQFAAILDEIGDVPIIVRSSSLLEDSFDAAFSGKYKSLFLSNRGTKEVKLAKLLDAAAEIFASVFGLDPIEYRKERGLLDFNEEMGLLIQEVVGTRIGEYFCPTFAGAAFSNNEFRWSSRIRLEDGAIRMVAGLGTRAVDRVGGDYPYLVSPGQPGLRVNQSYKDQMKYAQKKIDLINLETGKFETWPIDDILERYGDEIPGIEKIVSIDKEGTLSVPVGVTWNAKEADMVVTFEGLLTNTQFLKQMKTILDVLSTALETPVDVEFAHNGENLYILQCRPQMQSQLAEEVSIPVNIHPESIIFTADKYVTSGAVSGIEHVVYVDHAAYVSLPELAQMKRTAETVSRLNQVLPRRKFILVGPGRWGSRGDIKLGVPVTYSDINNTAMLIEVAHERDGYMPGLSFGTHFFQDLVESNIKYLPLYPDGGGTSFDTSFFEKSENMLIKYLPDFADMQNVVKVISLESLGKNSKLNILMDAREERAVGYIVKDEK